MIARRNTAIASIAAAILFFAIVYLLGYHVTVHGEPPALWRFAQLVHGKAIGLAWAFTNCGWIQVLGPLFLIACFIAVRFASWRARMIYLMSSCLITWGVTNALQRLFARPRRTDWLIRHEHSFSYPSSHASTSTAFYLLAGVLLLTSDLPAWARYGGFTLLAGLWLGICWSRLSLGAHYPTDVAGGIALGAGIALAISGIVRLAGKTAAGV